MRTVFKVLGNSIAYTHALIRDILIREFINCANNYCNRFPRRESRNNNIHTHTQTRRTRDTATTVINKRPLGHRHHQPNTEISTKGTARSASQRPCGRCEAERSGCVRRLYTAAMRAAAHSFVNAPDARDTDQTKALT